MDDLNRDYSSFEPNYRDAAWGVAKWQTGAGLLTMLISILMYLHFCQNQPPVGPRSPGIFSRRERGSKQMREVLHIGPAITAQKVFDLAASSKVRMINKNFYGQPSMEHGVKVLFGFAALAVFVKTGGAMVVVF